MTLVSADCDLCGGSNYKLLYPSTIGGEVDPMECYSSSRRRAGHLQIVRCKDCGLVRTNPRDDMETMQRVYATLVNQSYAREDANRLAIARQRLKMLRGVVQPGRLLDVGCATGIFAAEAMSRGWQATGMDPSAWAIGQARVRCPQGRFVQARLEEAAFPPGEFDLVTLWDVLEHLESPSRALQSVHPWLKPGGMLALNVPDIASLPARVMGKRWVLLLREHLWYFSPLTITRLLEKTGYHVHSIRPNTVRFSLANILTRLSQYPGALSPLCGRLAGLPLLHRIALPFAMGEITVLAQKAGGILQ